jgi:ABC-2 type transport system permease protein
VLSLYLSVATRAFRRYSTYTAATLAGIFTNCVFGAIICYVYLALWDQRPHAGGYTSTDAVTYVWLGQAMIMTMMVWGGGATNDLADRIRTGDVALDLYRPVPLIGWYAAQDLGRSAYHLVARGLAPTVVGALLFDIRFPGSAWAWLGFAVSIPLGVMVSFAIRFLFASTAFWLLDATGPSTLAFVLAAFFSGLTVPLVIFPGWTRGVVLALPWASYIQVPADIWLGKREGWELVGGLAQSAGWAALLLGACMLVLRQATRRVVVQGG